MRKILVIVLFFVFVFLVFPFFVPTLSWIHDGFTIGILAADKIDINTASLKQLGTLTGIGDVKAQAIIDARPFSYVDDLIRVKGIGEKTLQKIKNQGLAYIGSGAEEIASSQAPRNDDVQSVETRPLSKIEVGSLITLTSYSAGVVINEILPSPKGADEDYEWIELYNTSDFEIDLSGWKIKDKEGAQTNYFLPENTKISAYGYLVLKRPDTKITLNNTIDGITLLWPNEEIIDSITYKNASTNQSYNKIGGNWQWSISLTPGTKNIIVKNNAKKESENLPKNEKSGNKENEKGLAAISQSTNQDFLQSMEENINPWFLFLTAIIITIIFAVIFLILKIRIKP